MNNQIVIGTLMNLCDHPDTVSTGGAWDKDKKVQRVPIIVTGTKGSKASKGFLDIMHTCLAHINYCGSCICCICYLNWFLYHGF